MVDPGNAPMFMYCRSGLVHLISCIAASYFSYGFTVLIGNNR